jgi:hypothetical protein
VASFVYEKALTKILNATLDLDGHDIRLLLVGTTTTAHTETEKEFVGSFTTLGEFSGTGYARKTLTGEAVNEDLPNSRAEFDADDVTWTALGGGTVKGAVLYRFVTSDADSPVIAYIDTGGFPHVANGSDLTIQWNVEGILQLASA